MPTALGTSLVAGGVPVCDNGKSGDDNDDDEVAALQRELAALERRLAVQRALVAKLQPQGEAALADTEARL